MAEIFTIEGHTYAPLVEAAQHFGYTREYVLMHIADHKFEARKINGKWYVNLESATDHYATMRREKEAKRIAMSTARKAEFQKHAKKQTHHHVALVETLAVLVIGLSLGVTGYLGTTPQTQVATVTNTNTSTLDTLARNLYALVTGETNTSSVLTPSSLRGADDEAIQNPSALIVAPATTFTAEDTSSLQDSFSDPVTVTEDPNNPDMGVITPVFKEGREGEEYRYLMVPVKQK